MVSMGSAPISSEAHTVLCKWDFVLPNGEETTMHRYPDKTTAVSRGGWTDGLIQHVHHVKPVLGCARSVVRPRGGRISRGNVAAQVSQGICQVVHEGDPIDFPRHARPSERYAAGNFVQRSN